MSLDQIRSLRRAGERPNGVIVLVGTLPLDFDDGPGFAAITGPGMDLRALVGLPVHLIDIQKDPEVFWKALETVEQDGAIVRGICCAAGECGATPEHERAMRRYRERLCMG